MDQMDEITHHAKIEGAGASLAQGSFALSEKTADEKNAIAVTAVPTFEAGKTYVAKEPLILALDGETDAKGAVLLAPKGVKVSGKDAAVRNLTVIGDLSVADASNITLEQVAASSLTVAEDVCCLKMHDCRFGRVTNAGRCTVLMNTYVAGDILDTAESDTTVYGCSVDGAIKTVGNYKVLRGNTVGGGITVKGAENLLVALNLTESIKVEGSTNLSVILNEAHDITAEDNTSVYICDNATDTVHVKHNNYLLADGNTFSAVWDEANENTNGDTLMDVDARLPVGADERLLPHVNRDLFLETERREYVFGDPTEEEAICVEEYIMKHAEVSDRVILAPGAYVMRFPGRIEFTAARANTTVYAYGVLLERAPKEVSLYGHFGFTNTDNVTVKGVTVAYADQSCTQVYVVDKFQRDGKNIVVAMAGAGLAYEFFNSNPAEGYNGNSIGPIRAGTDYTYHDYDARAVEKIGDGLFEITVNDLRYRLAEKGDILTSKLNLGNTVIYITRSAGVMFKDAVVWGTSYGFAFLETFNRGGTTLYRVETSTQNGRIISKETYDRYRALEEKYGISFEVSIDEKGRYRGCPLHISTADTTHAASCKQGTQAISCRFEKMCDDGTNQGSYHARVAAIERDPNDPSVSIITYKGNYAMSNTISYRAYPGEFCVHFTVGDPILAYSSEGNPICDGPALSDAEQVMNEDGTPLLTLNRPMYERAKEQNPDLEESKCCYPQYRVKIKTADVRYDLLEAGYTHPETNEQLAYDLTDDHATQVGKIIIDNMAWASSGFLFDNTMVRKTRSRGFLIRASEGRIVNCTVKNVGFAAVMLACDTFWGESGIFRNVEIARNILDDTGYYGFYREDLDTAMSPVFLRGFGTRTEEDFLACKNIRIHDNIIKNRRTPYAMYINGARNIDIVNNDLGVSADDSAEKPTRAIRLKRAMNLIIEGNKYSPHATLPEERVWIEEGKNIGGADVPAAETE